MLRLLHPKEEDTFPHQIVCLQLVGILLPNNTEYISVSVDPVPSSGSDTDRSDSAGSSWWCDEVREEDRCISWPYNRDDGEIRCFVKLYPGQNEITFRCRWASLSPNVPPISPNVPQCSPMSPNVPHCSLMFPNVP